jgi:hypothetical protein
MLIILQDDVAHFSFPFEFDMFYKDESYSEENKGIVCELFFFYHRMHILNVLRNVILYIGYWSQISVN